MNALALPEELARLRSVVILAPHPDDEILGCGHLMRAFSQAEISLAVVWLTDGGAAFGPVPEPRRARLTLTRAAEALAGLQTMTIDSQPFFLGYPDGGLAQHSAMALQQISAIVRRRDADALFVTDEGDGHPDHGAAFRIAGQIPGPAIYSYPVSARYDGGEPEHRREAITIAATDGEAKRSGLLRHVSQHEGGEAIFPMTASAIERFCAAPELFYRIRRKQS